MNNKDLDLKIMVMRLLEYNNILSKRIDELEEKFQVKEVNKTDFKECIVSCSNPYMRIERITNKIR